jgi:hypothetical protein
LKQGSAWIFSFRKAFALSSKVALIVGVATGLSTICLKFSTGSMAVIELLIFDRMRAAGCDDLFDAMARLPGAGTVDAGHWHAVGK